MAVKRYVFDETTAFVKMPNVRAAWLRTHPCVVWTSCPQCKSEPGEPCLGRQGYVAYSHFKRRDRYKRNETGPARPRTRS